MRVATGLGTPVGRAGTFDRATRTFVPAFEVEIVGVAKRIVAESDAVGGALLTQIEREIDDGTLAVLPYRADWMRLDFGFIFLRGRSVSPAARAFMAEFRRLDAELSSQERVLQRRYKAKPEKRSARGPAKSIGAPAWSCRGNSSLTPSVSCISACSFREPKRWE